MSLITSERRNNIAQILATNGSMRVREMAAEFGVSMETIRKDLMYLDKKGIVKKSHGGAVTSGNFIERPINKRLNEHLEQKKKIAQKAIELISDKEVIFLDAGSTTFFIAKLLSLKKGYAIITNSVALVSVFTGVENSVYLIGGEFRPMTMSLTGLWAINALNTIRPSIAFLGTSGFQSHKGPCTESFNEAEIKKTIVENCRNTVVLGDSSKFKQSALVQYSKWNEIDTFITDNEAPEDMLKKIQSQTNIIVV